MYKKSAHTMDVGEGMTAANIKLPGMVCGMVCVLQTAKTCFCQKEGGFSLLMGEKNPGLTPGLREILPSVQGP